MGRQNASEAGQQHDTGKQQNCEMQAALMAFVLEPHSSLLTTATTSMATYPYHTCNGLEHFCTLGFVLMHMLNMTVAVTFKVV